ncbi:hypothetical protein [Jidongwangia harbinensis]|uniref:hypothetical protein n=1 Tax=Jidongwangia harbinensis TaxID=2878561 RepID=UPI001CD97791|nr:hypothetical protein [Jidongwangia harbinensis]MCA2216540.1 hypothetical protein [Jidongwangia harbinensis]
MTVLITPFLAVFDFFAMSTAGLGAPALAVFTTAYAAGPVLALLMYGGHPGVPPCGSTRGESRGERWPGS